MDFQKLILLNSKRNAPITIEKQTYIPSSKYFIEENGKDYKISEDLENTFNVALLTGKPLLLTGEPGCGKTTFANRVAWEFNLGQVLKFETKSTSKASDLFYYFNMLGYFQSAQMGKAKEAKEFITYNALGEAILLSNEYNSSLTPSHRNKHQPKRSVVLIDEIDKAPRDFPNDILNELEQLYFRIPELDNAKISVQEKLAPIIIITSNSEKNLPDAFLRRCIFHHIDFPIDNLENIVINRLQRQNKNNEFIKELIDFFKFVREQDLKKPPSTGELIVWIDGILKQTEFNSSPVMSRDLLKKSSGALLKGVDAKRMKTILDEWFSSNNEEG